MKFSGKNVLITGSSRGIGAEIAKTLAEFGLKVWINYKSSADKAEEIKKAIIARGKKAEVIGFDASNETDFSEAIKKIIEKDGELSYLVNNAGITKDKLALRMKQDDFLSVIEANLLSAFLGSKEALKSMSKARFGSVVNIASIVGEMGNAGQTNYSASKGGMIAMTKSFAKEGASRNIRFNSVTPGFIETQMTQDLKSDIKEEYIKNIPLKRLGNPREIAEGVAFLLSDHASYITGETLKINGGLLM